MWSKLSKVFRSKTPPKQSSTQKENIAVANGSITAPEPVEAVKHINIAGQSEAERRQLIFALRAKLREVETPWEQVQELIWENSAHAVALKIAHDLSVFSAWAESGQELVTVEQLAKFVKPCDVNLLDRVVKALAYKGTLDSPEPNKFRLNALSRALGEPTTSACLDYWFDIQLPTMTSFPEFLKSTSYALPADPMNTAWNFARKDPTPLFEWLKQNPEKMGIFARTMQCYSSSQPAWTELFPAADLTRSEEAAGPIVVDIGGSQGHDLLKYTTKFQPPHGSCYLQDRPEVLDAATLPETINKKPIDFFTESPVQGAQIYYLHSVLHDWTDDQCRVILRNVKTAMDPQKSKILIHELVRLEDGARDLTSVGEFTVMAILGAPERSERQWKALVESAELRLTKVYSDSLSAHAILQVEI